MFVVEIIDATWAFRFMPILYTYNHSYVIVWIKKKPIETNTLEPPSTGENVFYGQYHF